MIPLGFNRNTAQGNAAMRQAAYSKGLAGRGQVYGSVRPQSADDAAQIAMANQAVREKYLPSADPLGDFVNRLDAVTPSNVVEVSNRVTNNAIADLSPADQATFNNLSNRLNNQGTPVFNYSEEIPITSQVRDAIQSKIYDADTNVGGMAVNIPGGQPAIWINPHAPQSKSPTVLAHEAGHIANKHLANNRENFVTNYPEATEAEANLLGYALANKLNPPGKERYLVGTADFQGANEAILAQQKGINLPEGYGSTSQYLRENFDNAELNTKVNKILGDYQPPLAKALSNNPNPNAQILPGLTTSTPAQQQAMQAAEALALVDNAVGNSLTPTPIAARTIQRSPRAADMPPDPVPVFKSDPRFPSNIVNEVHQDLRRQATATGGVTGNNDAGFNYESRMQAGENIVPTGLNASQAAVIVDDAIAPMQINRHAADIDDNEIVGFSSYGNNINRSVPTQSAYADRMGVIPYEQLKNVGSVGEGSNPRREVTSTPIAKSQTEDEYYDQQFANQAARNPYGMPDVQRNPYADQTTVMQDNRGSGRVDNQANILNKTLATGAAVGGGLGAMALINNALGDSSGSSGGGNAIAQSDSPAPTPRAHFVIDKTNNTAQSFIDRGDGQLQPYKTMDVAGARDAWSKAKQAGWSTSFE